MTNEVFTKKQMRDISLGIAYEMFDTDMAELIADNGILGDHRVRVFSIRGIEVASTNGNPVWREEIGDEAWAEFMSEAGIKEEAEV